MGGTAVGTGLNTPEGYSDKVAKIISNETKYPFVTADNKLNLIESAVVSTTKPNLLNSFCKASILSVSLIFNVCIPVSLQETFNPRHVTHIVWAKSGLEDKSKDMGCWIFDTFSNSIWLFKKVVFTPKLS